MEDAIRYAYSGAYPRGACGWRGGGSGHTEDNTGAKESSDGFGQICFLPLLSISDCFQRASVARI